MLAPLESDQHILPDIQGPLSWSDFGTSSGSGGCRVSLEDKSDWVMVSLLIRCVVLLQVQCDVKLFCLNPDERFK